ASGTSPHGRPARMPSQGGDMRKPATAGGGPSIAIARRVCASNTDVGRRKVQARNRRSLQGTTDQSEGPPLGERKRRADGVVVAWLLRVDVPCTDTAIGRVHARSQLSFHGPAPSECGSEFGRGCRYRRSTGDG